MFSKDIPRGLDGQRRPERLSFRGLLLLLRRIAFQLQTREHHFLDSEKLSIVPVSGRPRGGPSWRGGCSGGRLCSELPDTAEEGAAGAGEVCSDGAQLPLGEPIFPSSAVISGLYTIDPRLHWVWRKSCVEDWSTFSTI